MNYAYHLVVLLSVYSILAASLNLPLGYGGMLSLCHAGFFGVGAYTTALLMVRLGWSFWATLPLAVVVAGVSAHLVGIVSLRFRGDFFVLSTLAVQAILLAVLNNWTALTNGPLGVPGIPRPAILGWYLSTPGRFAAFSLTSAVILVGLCARLVRSDWGRTLQAVRDDSIAAISLAKDPVYFRTSAFVISGSIGALAGSLYGSYISYIDPSSFPLDESVFIVAIVVIGGAGGILGPLLGTVILVLLPEALRFLHLPDVFAANVRQMLYGATLTILMFVRPRGIAGRYGFD